jgi:hypothetical protein
LQSDTLAALKANELSFDASPRRQPQLALQRTPLRAFLFDLE